MLRNVMLTFLIVSSLEGIGQHFSYPIIEEHGNSVDGFVPIGWRILDSASGDMNGNNQSDLCLVLQKSDSITLQNETGDTVLTQPRILLLLISDSSGSSFAVADRSNTFILRHESANMDDPYQNVSIKKGVLEISFRLFYSMGSWYVTHSSYKFRFSNGELKLIGAELSSLHRASNEYKRYSYNFLSKRRSVSVSNETDKKPVTKWKSLNMNTLKSLQSFPTPFTWLIEEDVHL